MRRWIVTFGGSGLSPLAPGTAGSAAAAALLLVLYALLSGGTQVPVGWFSLWCLGAVLASGLLCLWLGRWAIAHFGRSDPPSLVIDEVAGLCLTMIALPTFAGWQQWRAVLVAFVAFRIFDIVKPPPIRTLERLPHGWGILADDLGAAVYANVLCQVVLRWLLP